MKLSIYGQNFEVIKTDGKWEVFILGQEGKKRPAQDIVIPSIINEEDLVSYLEDLLHEYARPKS